MILFSLIQAIPQELGKLNEYGLLGTMLILTLTVIVYLFRDSQREKKKIYIERNEKEENQNRLEKEFRNHLMQNEARLIEIIKENSEALNRNSKAFEKISLLFENKYKENS